MQNDTVYEFQAALSQLGNQSVTLSDEVHAAIKHLGELEAAKPQQKNQAALIEAILAGASTPEQTTIAAELSTYQLRLSAWQQARYAVSQRGIAAVKADAHSIHAQLKPKALELIDQLEKAAAISTDVNALVLAGRHDDAATVANREIAAAELHELWNIRDLYCGGRGTVGGWDCSQFTDERQATQNVDILIEDISTAAPLINPLRRGARLWFPTTDEATKAAQHCYDRQAKEANYIRGAQQQTLGPYGNSNIIPSGI